MKNLEEKGDGGMRQHLRPTPGLLAKRDLTKVSILPRRDLKVNKIGTARQADFHLKIIILA